MRGKLLQIICLMSTAIQTLVYSQSEQIPDIAVLAEEIISRLNDDVQEVEVYDQLLLRFEEPLDLNSATEEELRALYLFSEDQISSLIQHREHSGMIISLLELQGLSFFDPPSIRRLMPFITVRQNSFNGWKNLANRIINKSQGYFIYRTDGTLINRFQNSADGGQEFSLPGSAFSGSFRTLISRPGDFRIGWNADRDRGEKFLWSPDKKWYGFDFNSFHFQLIDKPGIKNLIIGDYSASFGQGLVLGGGFSAGKGTDPVTAIRRASSGFRPYSSLGESGFFRGAAISLPLTKNLMFHGMFSRTQNDGQVRFDQDGTPFIQSFYSSGIHRSSEEQSIRKTWTETNLAAVMNMKRRNTEAAVVVNQQIFSLPLIPLRNIYSQFKFRGDRNLTGSFFLNTRYGNWTGFLEYATSFPSGGMGWVGGVLVSLSSSFDLSMLIRNYDPDFHSFHSTAFSEGTEASNEKGVFIGWKYRHGRKFQLSGYSDLFISPSFKYRLYKPSEGEEHLVRFQRNFSKKNQLTAQFRTIRKNRNSSNSDLPFFESIPVSRQVLSVQLDYGLAPPLSGRTRLLTTTVHSPQKSSAGNMIIQDFFLDHGRFKLNLRYSVFSADDFEARLYAYERDVWLSYSFPSWFGYGSRMYALGQFRLSEKLTAWVKWSVVRYTDSTPDENGLDEAAGKYKADLRLQFKWSL